MGYGQMTIYVVITIIRLQRATIYLTTDVLFLYVLHQVAFPEIVKSVRGFDVLLFDGYKYSVHRRSEKSTKWRCRVMGCKVRVTTENGCIEKMPNGEHTHCRNAYREYFLS